MEGIMKTFIYMVRHGDSPKSGKEKTRGLTCTFSNRELKA